MGDFNCTWQEFKNQCKELRDASKYLNDEELANGIKMMNLSYLGMSEKMWSTSAAILLKMMHRDLGAYNLQ